MFDKDPKTPHVRHLDTTGFIFQRLGPEKVFAGRIRIGVEADLSRPDVGNLDLMVWSGAVKIMVAFGVDLAAGSQELR
jgi:hypothetical protein